MASEKFTEAELELIDALCERDRSIGHQKTYPYRARLECGCDFLSNTAIEVGELLNCWLHSGFFRATEIERQRFHTLIVKNEYRCGHPRSTRNSYWRKDTQSYRCKACELDRKQKGRKRGTAGNSN